MRTDCDDCPSTDQCRHRDEPCAKRYDAERARERAAERYRVIEEADAEIRARQPEPEPHYLRPQQASLPLTLGVPEVPRG